MRRDLPGNLRDPDRAAELVGGFAADEHAADIGERAVDDEPGFLDAQPDRLRRRDRLVFHVARRHRAADAEDADALDVAEIVLDLLERRASP